MISAIYSPDDRRLVIQGHSNRPEVCGGVSCLTGTLYTLCDANKPASGKFEWTCSSDWVRELSFVLAALDTIALNYPADLEVVKG